MSDLRAGLGEAAAAAFAALGLPGEYGRITASDRPDLADFQCNGALAAAKAARKAPRDIAGEIVALLTDCPLLAGLGLDLNRRGALSCGGDWQTTAPGVFVCGDAHRGASLIVWAIAEGRSAARAVDAYLMGESDLPAPVRPSALPLAVV